MPDSALIAQTLVKLADNLVADFDVAELLHYLSERCVEALDVTAAGLLLVSPSGDLQVMASSSDEMRVLELFEVQANQGPCADCYRTGQPVVNVDLSVVNGRWPQFAPRVVAAGFRSVHALPMRLRGDTIGALNLFRANEGALAADDVMTAQAFADVATIAILQDRSARAAQTLNGQLAQALNTRITIEQAKGIIAQATQVDMGEAFESLRSHARNRNMKLSDVAQSVVDGTIAGSALRRPSGGKRP
jgi:GAF domain-containing protein